MTENHGRKLDVTLPDNPVLILGAEDPEMKRIEALLTSYSLPYLYAVERDGTRVNPRSAYDSDHTYDIGRLSPVVVECDPKTVGSVLSIDHHRYGDYGYDLGPADYQHASSLGQLSLLLSFEMTDDDKALSAMDHCFAAAVRGECPDIDPENVLDLKISEIAKSTNLSQKEVVKRIFKYLGFIRDYQRVHMCGNDVVDLRAVDLGSGYSADSLSFGVAQAMAGVATLASCSDASGRPKILFYSSDADQVRYFMNFYANETLDLTDVYGVPMRGYAGGYVQRM